VVFLIEKNVRVERHRTCDHLNHEKINGQHKVCTRSYQKHRDEEGRIVAFVAEVRLRDEMIIRIVVAEELTTHRMVAELVMDERLRK
jgi:hypothetical protein